MILLIDNYDSFSYNLYQLVGNINPDIKVIRNDEMTVEEIRKMAPDKIIISPGPGRPDKAGVCEEVVKELGKHIPVLGVCLGHQAICEAFGAVITYADKLMHGKTSDISVDTTQNIFKGMTERIKVARYHSLVAQRKSLPAELEVIADTDDGTIMAVKHREYEIYGLQFHPESILTPDGEIILRNFLGQCKK